MALQSLLIMTSHFKPKFLDRMGLSALSHSWQISFAFASFSLLRVGTIVWSRQLWSESLGSHKTQSSQGWGWVDFSKRGNVCGKKMVCSWIGFFRITLHFSLGTFLLCLPTPQLVSSQLNRLLLSPLNMTLCQLSLSTCSELLWTSSLPVPHHKFVRGGVEYFSFRN